MPIESGVSVVTDQAKAKEVQYQLGNINPWPKPLKFRLSFDDDPNFYLVRNPDGSFPVQEGYTNGVKHPDSTLTSYTPELDDPTTAVFASLINQGLTYTALELGTPGNAITIELIDPSAINIPLSVNVSSNDIAVTLATDGAGVITSTADDVKAIVNADGAALLLILVTGSGATPLVVLAQTNLTGGLDAVTFEGDIFSLLKDPSDPIRMMITIKKEAGQYNINDTANVITIYDEDAELYAICNCRVLNFIIGEALTFTIATEVVTLSTLDLINLGEVEKLIVADARLVSIANNIATLQQENIDVKFDYRLGSQVQVNNGEATHLFSYLPSVPNGSRVVVLTGTHLLTTNIVVPNKVFVEFADGAIFDQASVYSLTFQDEVQGNIRVTNDQANSVTLEAKSWILIEADSKTCLNLTGSGVVTLNDELISTEAPTRNDSVLRKLEGDAIQTDLDGFPDALKNLLTAEINQLENINANVITTTIWAWIASMNQSVSTTDNVTFNNLLVNGTVIINGATVQIDSQITTTDTVLLMNEGEVGAGVTNGFSGLLIDRGTGDNYFFGFDEVRDAFVIGQITAETAGQIATCLVLAARENTPTDDGVSYWNAATAKFLTSAGWTKTSVQADIDSRLVNTDNLSDVSNVATARANLDVPSTSEVAVEFQTSKDLVFNVDNSTQATATCSRMSLLDSNYAPKYISLDATWDMATDRIEGAGVTNKLPSTWYQAWIDSSKVLKLAPDLEGVADSDVLNSLSDSTAAFQTYLVQIDDEIYQTTDNIKGFVKAISSENIITCKDKDGADLDLFPTGTESYKIRMLSPPGLGENRERVGAVYNNSSSNLDNSTYTQIQEPKIYDGDYFAVTPPSGTISGLLATVKQVNSFDGVGTWVVDIEFRNLSHTGSGGTYTFTGGIEFFQEQAVSASHNLSAYIYASASASTLIVIIVTTPGRVIITGNGLILIRKPSFAL